MKRLRSAGVAVCAALVVTACGTTVHDVGGRDAAPTAGGLGVPAAPRASGGSDVASTTPGAVLPGGGLDTQSAGDGGTSGLGSEPDAVQDLGTQGTSTRSPIQIGVLVTDTLGFQTAAGGTSFSLLTQEAIHAFIKALNAAGGVAGRKLSVVDFTFNYMSQSYDVEFEAACQKFTVDNHVGAVIYDGVVYNQNFNTCMTKAGVPTFLMHQVGTQVGDSTDLANHPGMITAGSVSVDRRLNAILTGALAKGFLRPGSKVGVIAETCPYNVRAYDRVFAPFVKRHKISVVKVDVNCGSGASDQGTGTAAAQSSVLRFQSEGVDNIMFNTNFENGLTFFFAAQAEAQQYKPQYLLWHNQGCAGCMDYFRSKGAGPQLENMKGFGSSPLWEVTYPPAPPPAQAAVRKTCLATAHRQNIATPDLNAQAVVLDTCDVVSLLARALTLTGGQGGTRAVASAVERFGTDFVSTMVLTGATRFGPGLHDGTAMGAVSAYSKKCECFVYITPPAPIA